MRYSTSMYSCKMAFQNVEKGTCSCCFRWRPECQLSVPPRATVPMTVNAVLSDASGGKLCMALKAMADAATHQHIVRRVQEEAREHCVVLPRAVGTAIHLRH